ncbi:cupin domain-containing protein [Burkholderia plantarii]|uniref:cupin domain-containing protein n=1 Tax=Burkholderia plantarii TaxID=41899 RepID=UPI0007065D47|nr:cupin domain-containing protein [Burkholderia plantarii]ALK34051.1 Cupin 2 conserved barrel domain protein [Burkholderia plantarii]GLZ21477.1 hypothetical protein Bpla01_50060 [Burkholderia plantarii]
MPIQEGTFMSFSAYLDGTRPLPEAPAIWRRDATWRTVGLQPRHARGSVALTRAATRDATEAAPGLSLTAQRVEPGMHAPLHSHSFWHLYSVLSGQGCLLLDDAVGRLAISPGDWVFVPAWCSHAIDNRDGLVALELYALQNVPQNAALGNLARAEPGQPIHLTYAGS